VIKKKEMDKARKPGGSGFTGKPTPKGERTWILRINAHTSCISMPEQQG